MTAFDEEINGKVRMVRAMKDRQEFHTFKLSLAAHNARAAADERMAAAIKETEHRIGRAA